MDSRSVCFRARSALRSIVPSTALAAWGRASKAKHPVRVETESRAKSLDGRSDPKQGLNRSPSSWDSTPFGMPCAVPSGLR